MRIQHNIMAMNAYRNYNNNNKALSGNLEKLSSGYKINRAGDDAAGLAISEKMRAQITGLNAASKNVKDGISLVKTAEGAMQEIQDMLNRMDYLATQSANGTYQDEVDREALQKEVNQLKDEINRIADSANFNGIKLLDGTWDVDGKDAAIKAAQAAIDAANDPAKVDPAYNDSYTNKQVQNLMLKAPTAGAGNAASVGQITILETENIERQKPSFEVNFNGMKHTMSSTNNATAASGIGLTVSGMTVTITEQDIFNATGKEIGEEVTSEDLAKTFMSKINDTAATTLGQVAITGTDGTAHNWNVKQDGEKLVFEFADSVDKELNEHYNVSFASGTTTTHVNASGKVFTTGAYSVGTTGQTSTYTISAEVNGETVEFTAKLAGDTAAANLGTGLAAAEGTLADGTKVKLSDYFTVAVTNTNQYDIKSKEGEGKLSGNVINSVTVTGGGAGIADGSVTNEGKDGYTPGTNGYLNAGTEVTVIGTPAASEQLASTSIDLKKLNITDGMKIKLGNQEFTFAVGKDSVIDPKGENVIDLTDFEAADLKVSSNATTAQNVAASKLAEAAKDNDIFTVSHTGTNGMVGLKQLAEAKDSTDMTTMDKFASYIGVTTVDEKATEALLKEAQAKKAEDLVKAKEDLAAAEADGAKALNLQIGDTSDDFNQLGVKIGSMKTDALKITDLSIGTADDAAASIDVIKDAINYVSSVRGDLGAYQNRLDHTANNLSVMAENIQDAESTIRDTDVAEEMMSYVKNNILVQSAQAMLAQANQVPQGVLQLLG